MGLVSDWLVRRAGLARVALLGLLLGLVASSRLPPNITAATFLLAVTLAGLLLQLLGCGRPGEPPLSPVSPWGSFVTRADLHPKPSVAGKAGRRFGLAPWLIVVAALISGMIIGWSRIENLASWASPELNGTLVIGSSVVTGSVFSGPGYDRAPGRLESLEVFGGPSEQTLISRARGRKFLLELRVQRQPGVDSAGRPSSSLQPQIDEGVRLKFKGRLRLPRAVEDGGFDERSYLRRQGIFAIVSVEEPPEPVGRRGGIVGLVDAIRRASRRHLSLGLSARFSGLLRGVILGEQAVLEEADKEAFRASGTAHVLSVSGLHVASLASVVLVTGGLAGLPRLPVLLLAGLLAFLFVPLTGAAPPVLRAALTFLLFLLGEAAGKGRDRSQLLLMAAAGILALNPFSVADTGFQLSFAAAAAMLFLTRRLESLLAFLPGPLATGLAVSLAATAGTAPIALFSFGQVSLSGIAANLLVVPLMAPLMGLGMAAVTAGFFSSALAAKLNLLSAILLAWTIEVAHLFGRFPLLRVEHLLSAVAAVLALLLSLPLAAALVRRPPPYGQAWPLFGRLCRQLRGLSPCSRRLRMILALALSASLVIASLGVVGGGEVAWERAALVLAQRGWPSSLEVRALDVGEGSATLIRTPDRRAVLLDGGPRECGLSEQLQALGVRKLDLVIISHPHADHFAGLLEAMREIGVEAYVDSVRLPSQAEPRQEASQKALPAGQGSEEREEREAERYGLLRDQLAAQGARRLALGDGATITLGQLQIELRRPAEPVTLPAGEELNDASIVAVVRSGPVAILIPGDAEAGILRSYELAPVDAIFVPHHGSRGAVTPALLRRLSPRVAVISVGRDNSFGHPHEEVLEDLEEAGTAVLRTDLQGWVALQIGVWGLAVSTATGQASRPAERGPPGEEKDNGEDSNEGARGRETAPEARLPHSGGRRAQG